MVKQELGDDAGASACQLGPMPRCHAASRPAELRTQTGQTRHDSPLRQRQQGRDLRNSRGGSVPRVLEAVQVCVDAGAHGITVHPRADRRHITPDDVRDIAHALAPRAADGRVQHRRRSAAGSAGARAARCGPTSARSCRSCRARSPARPAGPPATAAAACRRSSRELKARGHPREPVRRSRRRRPIRLAAAVGRRSRRALHRAVRAGVRARPRRGGARHSRVRAAPPSSPHARAWASTPGTISISRISCCSATLPHLDEVSIGHALISRALFVGLDRVVREYLAVWPERPCARASPAPPSRSSADAA